MKLSDAISTAYLTNTERAEASLGGAGMIYDVRQSTTYDYASPVAYARHVLRLTPINRDGQRVHVAALEIDPEAAASPRGPGLLRQSPDLDRRGGSHTRP